MTKVGGSEAVAYSKLNWNYFMTVPGTSSGH